MNRDKILVVLYAYEPFNNANSNVMIPILSGLKAYHDIHLVTLNYDNRAPKVEEKEGITVFRYPQANKFLRFLHSLYYMDAFKKRNGLFGMILPILHLISVLLHRFSFFQHPELKLLRKLISNNSYSVIISTCESFLSCYHILTIKKQRGLKCPWVCYFMDPFCKYYKNVKSKKYLKQELDVYRNCTRIMVTEEIYNNNKTNEFAPFLSKTFPVKFANFNINNKPLTCFEFDPKKINCVYAGSLINDQIRDPSFFFEVAKELKNTNLVFHMICYHLPEKRLNEYKAALGDTNNVLWYDSLPFEECKEIIANADLLINISNRVNNQTPSKVFDYIGTGLPIVNFYCLKDDTSKKYLANYPYKINIFEDCNNTTVSAELLYEFAVNNKGKRIKSQILEELYDDYQSEKVVSSIISLINDCTTEKGLL